MTTFKDIEGVIKNRRTIKPQQMNGRIVPDEQIKSILSLADYAPNHGLTEPWRFIVYPPGQVKTFCASHAELYKANTSTQNFEQGKYDKLYTMGDMASHVVIAIMQRGNLPKIPVWEEKAATSCAIQNILLGAAAMDIASYWGSGGMAQHDAFKTILGLKAVDFVMGILYFGYADKTAPFLRNIPFEEKITWV